MAKFVLLVRVLLLIVLSGNAGVPLTCVFCNTDGPIWEDAFNCTLVAAWEIIDCDCDEVIPCNCVIHPGVQVQDVQPPETSCACGGEGGIAKVTIHAGGSLTPSQQYCFLKIADPVNWHSAPQAFGPGTTTLQFGGVPNQQSDYELEACVTSSLAAATAGQSELAPQLIRKSVSTFDANASRSANVEYDCMGSYDFRGNFNTLGCSDLQLYVENKYRPVAVCPIIDDDELQIPVVDDFTSEQQLNLFIRLHWYAKFQQGILNPSFDLDGWLMAAKTESYHPELPPPLGVTYTYRTIDDNGNPTGGGYYGKRGCASLVWVQRIRNEIPNNTTEQAKCCKMVAAHEIGHALFGLRDADTFPSDHNGKTCLMLPVEVYNHSTVRDMSFCDWCKQSMMAHDWEWTTK